MSYQSITTKGLKGSFPTEEWFEEFDIDSRGKTLIDYGCAEGVMCYLASLEGAKTLGVDKNKHRIKTARKLFPNLDFRCENIAAGGEYDIGLFSMIIHWLDDPQHDFRLLLDRILEHVIVIYRIKNDGYQEQNGKWFPTPEELNSYLYTHGFDNTKTKLLMTQDNNKQIQLKIFKRFKRSWIKDGVFYKMNTHLGREWRERLLAIDKEIPLLAIITDNGYKMPIFKRPPILKNRFKEFLKELERAFEKTGLMFEDITINNIMMDDDGLYRLVDLDDIGSWNPNNDRWKEINAYFS